MSATKKYFHDEICQGIDYYPEFFDCTTEKESLCYRIINTIDSSCAGISELVTVLDKYRIGIHNFQQSIMNLPIDELSSLFSDIDKHCSEQDFDNFDHDDLPI